MYRAEKCAKILSLKFAAEALWVVGICAKILSLKFAAEVLWVVGIPETFDTVLLANNVIISHCRIPLEKRFIHIES